MKKQVLLFGTISGIIVSTVMAISMAVMGCDSADAGSGSGGMIIGFASMAVAFSFVFVGIKNFRDKTNGGTLTFGKGFLLGVLISFIASTIYVLTWAVEYHFFLPDFMDKYSAMQIRQLQEKGISGPEYAEAITSIETAKVNYKNPLFFAAYTYMEILPLGILIALISALILRKKTAERV